jgi:hypothetical protein
MSNETVVVEQFTKPKSNATKADLVKYIDHLVLENDKYVEKLAKANKRIVDKDDFIETLKTKINNLEKNNNSSLSLSQANILKQELETAKTNITTGISEINKLKKVPTWIRKIFGA